MLFYGHDVIAENWLNVFHIWDGGMSFHGGLLGVLAATLIFARVKRKNFADVFDFVAPLPGIGLFAGRIGNFINGELWGKPTDVPWGFAVPGRTAASSCATPRSSTRRPRGTGAVRDPVVVHAQAAAALAPTGLFLLLYGCARFAVEWVRLPDANIGYLVGDWLTMGMLLTHAR